MIHLKYVEHPGDDYMEHQQEYGLFPFPADGVLVVAASIPS